MPPTPDYYAVLGVLPDAEDIVIRAAYKALAQRYHPDRFKGPAEEAHRRMVDINEAFAVLSDPVKRREYDGTRNTEAQGTQPRSSEAFGKKSTRRQGDGRPYYGKPTFRPVERETYFITQNQGAIGGFIVGFLICYILGMWIIFCILGAFAFAGIGVYLSLIRKGRYYEDVEITSMCLKCGGIGQVTAMDGTYIGFQCPRCKNSWKKRDRG